MLWSLYPRAVSFAVRDSDPPIRMKRHVIHIPHNTRMRGLTVQLVVFHYSVELQGLKYDGA
jgi:hypothetical protein